MGLEYATKGSNQIGGRKARRRRQGRPGQTGFAEIRAAIRN
jgi:hypothetical protein